MKLHKDPVSKSTCFFPAKGQTTVMEALSTPVQTKGEWLGHFWEDSLFLPPWDHELSSLVAKTSKKIHPNTTYDISPATSENCLIFME